MGINPTNDFNVLGQFSQKTQNRLMMLALNGDSIVNPFSDELDQEGVTPEGRARKERKEEEERSFQAAMAQLEERTIEFQRELDRLDQASLEALRENEEQLREAREELRKIRERAYQIHLPDGTLARVYRDGDKVRMETGTEVSRAIVKAEDLGDGHSTWREFVEHTDLISGLQAKHETIMTYRRNLRETDEKFKSGGLSASELGDADRQLRETMPDSVRSHYGAPDSQIPAQPGLNANAGPMSGGGLAVPFAHSASGSAPEHVLSEKDFEATKPLPAASTRAPG